MSLSYSRCESCHRIAHRYEMIRIEKGKVVRRLCTYCVVPGPIMAVGVQPTRRQRAQASLAKLMGRAAR